MMEAPFIKYFVSESLKKMSLSKLLDADINLLCKEIKKRPIDVAPKMLGGSRLSKRKMLCLSFYPSIDDSENFFEKSENFIESIHEMKFQAVFEIKGNKEKMEFRFYGTEQEIAIIEAGLKNYFPKGQAHVHEPSFVQDKYVVYDFIPDAPFYKQMTSYGSFTLSPINILALIFFNMEKDCFYQVMVRPLPGNTHDLIKEATDCEWTSSLPNDKIIPPSLQISSINEKIESKSRIFRSFYSVCMRIFLPKGSKKVEAFISNYSYGSKAFRIISNSDYSKEQISEMVNKRVSFHTGFILNAHELAGILHVPFQLFNDRNVKEKICIVPPGDKPDKLLEESGIFIGKWRCGSFGWQIYLPMDRNNPHCHICGIPRTGKSLLQARIALERFLNREAVIVIDPHGDLIANIMRMIPKERIDDVVVLDFGLEDYTPQMTIRANVDLNNPSKVSDNLSDSMRNVSSTQEKFFGPRMAYIFGCLYYIYAVLPDLHLADIRHLLSTSKKYKTLRNKVKARIKHPVVRDFLDEINYSSYETIAPALSRLSHLLLDEKSLRLFTLDKSKISIREIMETEKLLLVNLSSGIIGKQRSSILSGLIESFISNAALARAALTYHKRKPVTIIKDEFWLSPMDLDSQLTELPKYGVSMIFAHQYLSQVEGKTRDVMGTASSKILFRIRPEDAEFFSEDLRIKTEELTALKPFEAFIKSKDEVLKISTPKPIFPEDDFSELIMKNNIESYYSKNAFIGAREQREEITHDEL